MSLFKVTLLSVKFALWTLTEVTWGLAVSFLVRALMSSSHDLEHQDLSGSGKLRHSSRCVCMFHCVLSCLWSPDVDQHIPYELATHLDMLVSSKISWGQPCALALSIC